MRIFVMFDLPTVTSTDRKAYRKFREYLIKNGFIMMQESVYSKLCLNATVANVIKENLRKHKPVKGIVEVLIVTERQYASIEYIVGEERNEVVSSTERLVVL